MPDNIIVVYRNSRTDIMSNGYKVSFSENGKSFSMCPLGIFLSKFPYCNEEVMKKIEAGEYSIVK